MVKVNQKRTMFFPACAMGPISTIKLAVGISCAHGTPWVGFSRKRQVEAFLEGKYGGGMGTFKSITKATVDLSGEGDGEDAYCITVGEKGYLLRAQLDGHHPCLFFRTNPDAETEVGRQNNKVRHTVIKVKIRFIPVI